MSVHIYRQSVHVSLEMVNSLTNNKAEPFDKLLGAMNKVLIEANKHIGIDIEKARAAIRESIVDMFSTICTEELNMNQSIQEIAFANFCKSFAVVAEKILDQMEKTMIQASCYKDSPANVSSTAVELSPSTSMATTSNSLSAYKNEPLVCTITDDPPQDVDASPPTSSHRQIFFKQQYGTIYPDAKAYSLSQVATPLLIRALSAQVPSTSTNTPKPTQIAYTPKPTPLSPSSKKLKLGTCVTSKDAEKVTEEDSMALIDMVKMSVQSGREKAQTSHDRVVQTRERLRRKQSRVIQDSLAPIQDDGSFDLVRHVPIKRSRNSDPTESKPMTCPYCSFEVMSTNTSLVTRHVRDTHRREWITYAQVVCKFQECDYRCTSTYSLKNHSLFVHGKEFESWRNTPRFEFPPNQLCPFCPIHIDNILELKMHVDQCHQLTAACAEAWLICKTCNTVFHWLSDVFNHWRKSKHCNKGLVLRRFYDDREDEPSTSSTNQESDDQEDRMAFMNGLFAYKAPKEEVQEEH